MDDADTLTIRPNYPGLLMAILLLGFAAGISLVMLLALTRKDVFGPALFDWLLLIFLIVFIFLFMLGSLYVLWGHIAVLFSGLRPSMAVRLDRQGIHYPLRYDGLIPWAQVHDIQVHQGYNGMSLWFKIDPSLPLRGYSVLDHIYSIGNAQVIGYVRLLSHQYSFSAPELMQELRRLAPERVHMAYPLS
ncbi:MAG: hypothetical protein KGZ68_07265 [Dechloromonas sp.]|jgi:hypothetical protein|nr:hypothetical protein [Dechloromonas sp.]